ncbi:MAG: hypothetical protein RTU30_12605 [Candidatus Thorarchaeota archaeon]
MRIESIVINVSRKRIFHTDSTGQREFKLERPKEAESEFYSYIERHVTENNGRLHSILTTPAGWRAILIFE